MSAPKWSIIYLFILVVQRQDLRRKKQISTASDSKEKHSHQLNGRLINDGRRRQLIKRADESIIQRHRRQLLKYYEEKQEKFLSPEPTMSHSSCSSHPLSYIDYYHYYYYYYCYFSLWR